MSTVVATSFSTVSGTSPEKRRPSRWHSLSRSCSHSVWMSRNSARVGGSRVPSRSTRSVSSLACAASASRPAQTFISSCERPPSLQSTGVSADCPPCARSIPAVGIRSRAEKMTTRGQGLGIYTSLLRSIQQLVSCEEYPVFRVWDKEYSSLDNSGDKRQKHSARTVSR